MNNSEMIDVAARLRKCAKELEEIATMMNASAHAEVSPEEAKEIADRHNAVSGRLVEALAGIGIGAKVVDVHEGPTFTRVKIDLPPGVKYSKVTDVCANLQSGFHAKSLRIEAPIPGEEYVAVEIAKEKPEKVSFADAVLSEVSQVIMRHEVINNLPVVVGKGVDGKTIVADLSLMPHLIVGGAPDQGTSHFIHSFICGLIARRSPEEVQFIIADTKCMGYSQYDGLPHLVAPVMTDNSRTVFALHWAVCEMEKRLKLFAKARVRNIADFNSRMPVANCDMFSDDEELGRGSSLPKTIPYIVIVIDDFADAMAEVNAEIEPDISRLTAKARAAGIHLVLVTQRPDAEVFTGTIKANVPGRITFKMASSSDSEEILDDVGAEQLIGNGDCLFKRKDGVICRAQAPEIGDTEIEAIVAEAKRKHGEKPANKPGIMDEDVQKAIEVIRRTKKASTSHFQRQLGYGYNHAAELIDRLENEGYVEPPTGMGPRTINWEKFAE